MFSIDGDVTYVDTPVVLVLPRITFKSTALQTFLTNSITHGMVTTIQQLVSGACFSARHVSMEVLSTVPLHDTYIVLLLARLVFRVGSVNQGLLSALLSVFVIARPQARLSSLPITRAQIIRVITNKTNQSTLASRMPTPRPNKIGGRHAYLELEEAIGHALGLQPKGKPVLGKYQRLMDSKEGKNCLVQAKQKLNQSSTNDIKHLV
jgi:hypothetical protein